MSGTIYNSGIPLHGLNPVRLIPLAHIFFLAGRLSFILIVLAISAAATDWSQPEQQLAKKIVAVAGPGAVTLSVENRSSLGKREQEIIQNGLRSTLEAAGLRFVDAEQAAATVAISLSQNATDYVWVAQIRQGASETSVVMVSMPRPAGSVAVRESVPLSLRKNLLWMQDEAVLDVAVLEDSGTPTHIAVLNAERVGLYRWQAGKWQQEQALNVVHTRPWPRDLRGRLVPARDHLLDVYLPGVICRSTAAAPLSLICRETDDPWPVVPAALSGATFPGLAAGGLASSTIPAMGAFYASTRNFFTGVLTSGIGKFTSVPKFYSAAFLPREKYLLWLFAATDGHVHMIDGVSDQVARFAWGSDVTTVKTACGAGWQVLATSSDGNADSVRAYEFPDRDPVAVTAPTEFSGAITALWTEAKGDAAIAVVRNRETGNYEVYRLAVVCSQ
ncbi:MAG TPA: hypothetical protein VH350_19485 [Candidatus Sulfotelmatobacter sp.]|nr:hypothetical protein [Candidatus Sulfotelmatobacter sp.]